MKFVMKRHQYIPRWVLTPALAEWLLLSWLVLPALGVGT